MVFNIQETVLDTLHFWNLLYSSHLYRSMVGLRKTGSTVWMLCCL